jgi:predicted RNase H-like HicB family nuclease
MEQLEYLVVIEQGARIFGAFVPDLPGCVAVGKSREEVEISIQEAIEAHIKERRAEDKRVPRPRSIPLQVTVNA